MLHNKLNNGEYIALNIQTAQNKYKTSNTHMRALLPSTADKISFSILCYDARN